MPVDSIDGTVETVIVLSAVAVFSLIAAARNGSLRSLAVWLGFKEENR